MGDCCTKPQSDPGGDDTVIGGYSRQEIRDIHNNPALLSIINKYVLETLSVIRTLVDNDQEPPLSMLKLHSIADQEAGWLLVVRSMVQVIPLEDPLGPAVITLLLDDCPLPSKETVVNLCQFLNLCKEKALSAKQEPLLHRNICIILGCIAEKLAGPSSVALLTQSTLEYILYHLNEENNPWVILFAIIALEKFAQTSENKSTIENKLGKGLDNKLCHLEKWYLSEDFLQNQVGFCAQWCLDNLFCCNGRTYSYENIDNGALNAMLNNNDVTEYLKISPDGLQARCDASSFESVRCTFQVDSGSWYYEVTLVTAGVMQIGWATKDSKFLNHEGFGIGDDEFSIAYDGCRQLIWHKAQSSLHKHPPWKPGDVLGVFLEISTNEVTFYLNGSPLEPLINVFKPNTHGFFAAASFMAFQQCKFNFGSNPFKFPPRRHFLVFNDHASLQISEKIILPRHIRLQKLREMTVDEGSCTLCFDQKASTILLPCLHKGFCWSCSLMLTVCPMCRHSIEERKHIDESYTEL